MKITLHSISFILIFLISGMKMSAQNIELFEQFNGRYDYYAIGNTLNLAENNATSVCQILTQSSAQLNLLPTQNVIAAYLYWAGSGHGDFNVELNGTPVSASRTFNDSLQVGSTSYMFFAAFADVTTQIQNTGNGTYTFSELDLSTVIPAYCNWSLNFGGWAITIVYEDSSLNYNQVNIYDGLEGFQFDSISFTISNLNVVDTQGAKAGFLVWEGDTQPPHSHSVGESITVNGVIMDDPPLNPNGNIFNNTNSFTGANDLWNMDIDVFDISSAIQVGDNSAVVTLTTGQDVVLLNNVITVLSNELPDATVEIDTIIAGEVCGSREIFLEYTVYNVNSTAVLPAGTPIAFYANSTLIGNAATINVIPIDGSETQQINLIIPSNIPNEFTLTIAVDDLGNGTGIVPELDETNNEDSIDVRLIDFPEITGLVDQEKCEVVGNEAFDLTLSTQQIDPTNTITFHITQVDAENNVNAIQNPEAYINIQNPQTIYVRVDNGDCHVVGSFTIEVIFCSLPDATIFITEDLNACRQRQLEVNYVVANTDGTAPLPAQTPIAFYIDEVLTATDFTPISIPAGGQINMTTLIELSDNVPDVFELKLSVDDIGDGTGIVEELDETNNTYITTVNLQSIPDLPPLSDMELCNEGFGFAVFDLTLQFDTIQPQDGDEISFYTSFDDAIEQTNPIFIPYAYQSNANPQTIYVRLDNEICFTISSFEISTIDCPPWIPEGFSPNNDGINDFFEISGLLDIYPNHEILIYTRKGNLIFKGNNQTGFWDGRANTGLLYEGPVPAGVYYYVLNLNHPDYDLFIGWVYLNK
jgi:gliding motility-associated-like protein